MAKKKDVRSAVEQDRDFVSARERKQKKAKQKVKAKAAPAKAAPVAKPVAATTLAPQPSQLLADPVLKGAAGVLALASLVKVTDAESANNAGTMLVQVKQFTKQVEEKKSFIVKPLKDHAKRLESMFKPTLDKLDAAEAELKQKILAYRAEAAEKVRAETQSLMEKATEAQESGDSDGALALAVEAQSIETVQKTTHFEGTGGSMQEKQTWTFEVTAFGEVPHEYFTLDEKKIRQAIKAGLRDIPGVRIFQTSQLAVTTVAPMMLGGEEALS